MKGVLRLSCHGGFDFVTTYRAIDGTAATCIVRPHGIELMQGVRILSDRKTWKAKAKVKAKVKRKTKFKAKNTYEGIIIINLKWHFTISFNLAKCSAPSDPLDSRHRPDSVAPSLD